MKPLDLEVELAALNVCESENHVLHHLPFAPHDAAVLGEAVVVARLHSRDLSAVGDILRPHLQAFYQPLYVYLSAPHAVVSTQGVVVVNRLHQPSYHNNPFISRIIIRDQLTTLMGVFISLMDIVNSSFQTGLQLSFSTLVFTFCTNSNYSYFL